MYNVPPILKLFAYVAIPAFLAIVHPMALLLALGGVALVIYLNKSEK